MKSGQLKGGPDYPGRRRGRGQYHAARRGEDYQPLPREQWPSYRETIVATYDVGKLPRALVANRYERKGPRGPLPRVEAKPDTLIKCGRHDGKGCGKWLPAVCFGKCRKSPNGRATICLACRAESR